MLTTSGRISNNNCDPVTQWKIEMSILLTLNILKKNDVKGFIFIIIVIVATISMYIIVCVFT